MNASHLTHSTRIAVIACSMVVFHCHSAGLEKVPVTEANIPRSIFVVPINARQGRDPFYPNSTRLLNVGVSTNTAPSTKISATISVILNWLSGSAGHRLAMINGRTLAEGESSDFPSGGTFVKVLCVEIKENSVVVEVGGARQELTMHK